MYVVGKRRVMIRIHICLAVGGVLWMTMYGASPPNIIVNSLLYRKKAIQHVRKRGHL